MIKIAVCDDDERQLEWCRELINEYVKKRAICAQISIYHNPDDLLRACDNCRYDIYILDIVMPFIDGIELAKGIRRLSMEAAIIFMSSEKGYALDAYSVNPLTYIVKPVEQEALFSALDRALMMQKPNQDVVGARTKDGYVTIPAALVEYIEYVGHKVVITTLGGERIETSTIKESFSDFAKPLLKCGQFIKPHRSFVINMGSVRLLGKDGFTLACGAFIPISGRRGAEIRAAYLDFTQQTE